MTRQRTNDTSSSAVQSDEARIAGNGRGHVASAPAADGCAPQDGREPWIDAIAHACDEFGGVDLELPTREFARGFSLEE